MDYKNLGKCGLKVSPVCLSTMTFGREATEESSFAIMDYFVELGYNFLDSANAYSRGGSEEVVGRWMRARGNRQSIVLATKVFGSMGPGPNDGGLLVLWPESTRKVESSALNPKRFYVGHLAAP